MVSITFMWVHLMVYFRPANRAQRGALPDLQSLVVVLWKELFQNVSALVTNSSPTNQVNGEDGIEAGMRRKTNANSSASLNALANGHPEPEDPMERSIEATNEIRSREITAKTVSGIILILLKWFKVSRMFSFSLRSDYEAETTRRLEI